MLLNQGDDKLYISNISVAKYTYMCVQRTHQLMIQVLYCISKTQFYFFSLIVYVRFLTLTACLSSMFLSGPFHGKLYNLLETINAVKCYLLELTTKRSCTYELFHVYFTSKTSCAPLLVISGATRAHVSKLTCQWIVMWRIYRRCFLAFFSGSSWARHCHSHPLFPPSFPCFNHMSAACSSYYYMMAHGWGARICQPWKQSLSANSGSSWMSQAPNLLFSDAFVNFQFCYDKQAGMKTGSICVVFAGLKTLLYLGDIGVCDIGLFLM